MATYINGKQNSNTPLLSQVLQDADSINPEELPSLLAQVAALLGTLSAQLLTTQRGVRRTPQSDEDSLLTVTEAALELTVPSFTLKVKESLPFSLAPGV